MSLAWSSQLVRFTPCVLLKSSLRLSKGAALAALGAKCKVERVFEIGRRLAQAELLLLEDQMRLVVLVEAEANAEPHWPRLQRIAPPLPHRPGTWQRHERVGRPQDHLGPLFDN